MDEKLNPCPEYTGKQFKVKYVDVKHLHGCGDFWIEIYSEDDGNWFKKMTFDIKWLPELISLLQANHYPEVDMGKIREIYEKDLLKWVSKETAHVASWRFINRIERCIKGESDELLY